MQPLFSALYGCYQQVEILTDTLRKKDAELLQYRKEGAVLHRSKIEIVYILAYIMNWVNICIILTAFLK